MTSNNIMNSITTQKMYSKGSIFSPEGTYEWEGKSDGDTGSLKLTINGTDTKIIKFTKEELEDLFNQSVSRIPLDKRLMMDFMGDDDEYTSPFLRSKMKSRTTKKNKNRSKNKNKNKKSRKAKSRK